MKRKHDEVDKDAGNTNDELVLLDGISVPKSGSRKKSKKDKDSFSEEKRLKLEQEKVLNGLLLRIEYLWGDSQFKLSSFFLD